MKPERAARITAPGLARLKAEGRKIVCLTCFDAPTARICAEAGTDILLVGDTYGMVSLGLPNTLGVDLRDMVRAVGASRRGARNSFIVGDLPFMTFQLSEEKALKASAALLRAGAQAVKLEGAGRRLPVVRRLVAEGIPVMGHVGLLPQSVNSLGGYGRRGREKSEAKGILKDAQDLQKAGAFAVVLEHIPPALARSITGRLRIPTIGIGAGPYCDGQVLVLYDLLGLSPRLPPFAKAFARLHGAAVQAAARFGTEVRGERYPERPPGKG